MSGTVLDPGEMKVNKGPTLAHMHSHRRMCIKKIPVKA